MSSLMSRITVHQADSGKAAVANPFFAKVERALDAVRTRAFELFEKRGSAPGGELEDWLEAEKELFFLPRAEIAENEKAFSMKIAAPGFGAEDIEVIALPREILVEAKAAKKARLESRCFYRRFELNSPIETGDVRAALDGGQLTIDAPKKLVYAIPVRAAAA